MTYHRFDRRRFALCRLVVILITNKISHPSPMCPAKYTRTHHTHTYNARNSEQWHKQKKICNIFGTYAKPSFRRNIKIQNKKKKQNGKERSIQTTAARGGDFSSSFAVRSSICFGLTPLYASHRSLSHPLLYILALAALAGYTT